MATLRLQSDRVAKLQQWLTWIVRRILNRDHAEHQPLTTTQEDTLRAAGVSSKGQAQY
jgi:hypothetical protein